MSRKSIATVTVFVLISLALIAATTFSARGWFASASEVSGAHVFVLGPLTSNLSQEPSSAAGVEDYFSEQSGKGHNCESEAQVSPDD